MSTFSSRALALVSCLCFTQSSLLAQTDEPPKIVGAGLTYLRYPVQPSQIGKGNSEGYVPYQELMKSKLVAAPRTVTSLASWEKPIDENAILIGYIEIKVAGKYNFRTDSGYDRNELLIDDLVVCGFRDGPNMSQSVELTAGWHKIVSAAYATVTWQVRVQWMPPGKSEWDDIPNRVLGRTKFEAPK